MHFCSFLTPIPFIYYPNTIHLLPQYHSSITPTMFIDYLISFFYFNRLLNSICTAYMGLNAHSFREVILRSNPAHSLLQGQALEATKEHVSLGCSTPTVVQGLSYLSRSNSVHRCAFRIEYNMAVILVNRKCLLSNGNNR